MLDDKRKLIRNAFVYSIISLLCIVFGAIYENFSHEVYSFFMVYSFLIPFTGVLLNLIFYLFAPKVRLKTFTKCFYRASVATCTVGFIFKGIIDIYGTTNVLSNVYWIASGVLLIISFFLFLIHK